MTEQQRAVGVHPSIVSLKSNWNGYRYWCLFTPYPSNNSAFENPCLVASNDLINWVTPSNVLNPIDQPSTDTADYMRDTHLYFDDERQILCMMYLIRGSGFNKLLGKTFDGVNFSERYELWSGAVGTNDFASPSFWFNKNTGKWQAIGHNLDGGATWPILKMESDEFESGWGAQTSLNFPSYSGRKWWHSDFHLATDGNTVLGIVQDNNGSGGAGGNLYYCQSSDFLNFSADVYYLSSSGVYRSCLIQDLGVMVSQLGAKNRLITGSASFMNRGRKQAKLLSMQRPHQTHRTLLPPIILIALTLQLLAHQAAAQLGQISMPTR